MSERTSKVSRRRFLKYAGGVVVAGAVAAGGAYYLTMPSAGTSTMPSAGTSTMPSAGTSTMPIAGKELVIGGTLPLTGISAEDGTRILNGTKMAVDKINSEGGILGRPIKLIIYDDTLDLTKVGPLYEELITSDNVDMLVSPYGAPWTMPALAVAAKYNKLMIGGFTASTSPSTTYGGTIGFFPEAMPSPVYSSYQYSMYTDWLNTFDQWNKNSKVKFSKNVALLGENQLWGIEQHAIWKQHVEAQGWNIVFDEAVDITATDFSAEIAKMQSAEPDLVLAEFFYFRDVLLLKQMLEQKYYPKFLVMNESGHAYAWVDPMEGIGEGGNGIFCCNFFPDSYHGADADYLRTTYKQTYGFWPSTHESAGYSTIQIIRDALNKAGTTDQSAVREVLLSETFDTCWTKVQFDSQGSNTLLAPLIGEWQNNHLQAVYPPTGASANPVYPYAPP